MDGKLAASDTSIAATLGQGYRGWWKIGFDNLEGWNSVPSSEYFNGQLDDIHVYDRALSPSDIAMLGG